MVKLSKSFVILALLAVPAARGQQAASAAAAQQKSPAETPTIESNKISPISGLTPTHSETRLLQGVAENRRAEFFRGKENDLQIPASHAEKLSTELKSHGISVSPSSATNAVHLKNLSAMSLRAGDSRLLAAVQSANSRWKGLSPEDLNKR